MIVIDHAIEFIFNQIQSEMQDGTPFITCPEIEFIPDAVRAKFAEHDLPDAVIKASGELLHRTCLRLESQGRLRRKGERNGCIQWELA